MERIEEFKHGERSFIYIDFSGLRSGEDYLCLIELIKPIIVKYPEFSLYLITNIADIRVDSKTREIALNFLLHNEPYVKYSVIIGMDGIKKMMIDSVKKQSGRNNIYFAFSKEKAIELAMQQG